MKGFAGIWKRIGTRLYLALAFIVFLTFLSSGIGVYYFEKSGDANANVRSQALPVFDSAWKSAQRIEEMRRLGGLVAVDFRVDVEDDLLQKVELLSEDLGWVAGVPELMEGAHRLNEHAYEFVALVGDVQIAGYALAEADGVADRYRGVIADVETDDANSLAALELYGLAWVAEEEKLASLWQTFSALAADGMEEEVFVLGDGDGVFAIRTLQLAGTKEMDRRVARLLEMDAVLDGAKDALVDGARKMTWLAVGESVASFDEGRILLVGVSLSSVVVAMLVAWLWVGNGIVVRLSRISERMRSMAGGNLKDPVPEVGADEIGEMANAAEVFRQWAYEVQRLHLVQSLYRELRQAHEELVQMQERLVAQEKLAALGELVSGVAHEIRNPLSFVRNFSEGSQDLYGELVEMLSNYRDSMADEDVSLLDDISREINESLDRVRENGSRLMAIVEQMQSLGVSGGEPAMTDLNAVVRRGVEVGCDVFASEWDDFHVDPVVEVDGGVGKVMLVGQDFHKALVNLVTNACYSMRQKGLAGAGYVPRLKVGTAVVDETVEVRVWDNGVGIPAENLDHIFNPFFTTRSGVLGAGLGLMVAADVLRRCGGDVTVATEDGQYAEFTMRLPR